MQKTDYYITIYIYIYIGKSKNVYFAFDILNDTAIDVATEMVKELEIISDWDPLEIAVMIEKEISSLIPDWEEWKFPEIHHQDSFNYEQDHNGNDDNDDDDDDENYATPHPFYYCGSSHGSSSDSLHDFYPFRENPNHHFGGMDTSSTTEWFRGTSFSLYSCIIEGFCPNLSLIIWLSTSGFPKLSL